VVNSRSLRGSRGPRFRKPVDPADKVRAEEAWLACAVCLALVDADDREGLVERSMERLRRKDSQKGRERPLREEAWMRRSTRDHLEKMFWGLRRGLADDMALMATARRAAEVARSPRR
jgi:hypothetical protein